jgi:xanthine dehydrogenase accessory factor
MDIHNRIVELKKANKLFVLATIIRSSGSVPGKPGFKIIVDFKGNHFGTVGGGAIEKQIIADCLEVLKTGNTDSRDYILSDKASNLKSKTGPKVVPMKCKGRISVFFEIYGQRPNIFIFGGGHVGCALTEFVSKLNYFITLIDNRKEFANPEKNPFADDIIESDYEKYATTFKPKPDDFIVIVTHGHNFDFKILKILYERKLKLNYIGLIASQSKAREMINGIKKAFGKKTNVDNIYSPIGLKIGGDTAEEIALSIAAEVQSVRYNRLLIPQ